VKLIPSKALAITSLTYLAILVIFLTIAAFGRLWLPWGQLLFALPLFFASFSLPQYRFAPCVAMLGHHLGYGYPLAMTPYFYDLPEWGIIVWIGQAIVMASPWALLCWDSWKIRIPSLFGILIVTHIIPPWSYISYGSVLISMGWLFPSSGWLGFLLLAASITLLVFKKTRLYAPMGIIMVSLGLNMIHSPKELDNVTGITTHLNKTDDYRGLYRNLVLTRHEIIKNGNEITVTPEGLLSVINPAMVDELQYAISDKRRVIIACADTDQNDIIHRAIFIIDDDGYRPVYYQHMPPPGAMWRPWDSNKRKHFNMQVFRGSSFQLGSSRAGAMICYEMLIPWVSWMIFADNPDMVVGVMNEEPVSNTCIPDNQDWSMRSWARLFNTPVVTSRNKLPKGDNQ